MTAHRICKQRGCITILSYANPGDHCWVHTPDLTQQVRPERRKAPRRNVMSYRFTDGIRGTYDLTAAERSAYERWADALATEIGEGA